MKLRRRYKANDGRSPRRWLWLTGAVIAVLILASLLFVVFGADKASAPQPSSPPQSEHTLPETVSATYMFSGTVVLARAVENAAKIATGYDYSQPFSGMSTFEPKQYDSWLVDWECPSTDKLVIPYQQQIANLQFNCRPEWLPEFSKYFTHVNLANNHTSDLGAETFQETRQHLEKAGLQVVGNYDPGKTDDTCEVMSMPVRLKMPDGSETKGTLPIAMCAWHYFFRDPQPGEIETMQQYAKIMPVFGLMHAGVEYVPRAGANQEAIARKIIDNGAEFVVGNSPHWVQNTEVYKNKLIVYSTGNFIFDQLEAETNQGVSLAASMSVPYDDNVAKWLALGESCKTRPDNCLEEAQKQGLSKINATFTYEPVANTSGARQVTKRAPASIQRTVEQRMNWQQTLRQLGQQ